MNYNDFRDDNYEDLLNELTLKITNQVIEEEQQILNESQKNVLEYMNKSNIGLTDVEYFIKAFNLYPVTNPNFISSDNNFHSEGLFSEKIFGPLNSEERKYTFSYIDLSKIGEFLQPTVIYAISRYSQKLFYGIIGKNTKAIKFVYDEQKKILVESQNGALTGYSLIKLVYDKIDEITNISQKVKEIIKKNNRNIFTKYILVIPPELRKIKRIKGMVIVDEINDIYKSLIQYSNQYNYLTESDPLWDVAWKTVQSKIYDLYNCITNIISKKEGLFRNKVLSKRIDFNVSSTVINNSKLNSNEIGLPYRLSTSLCFYFLIHVLMNKDSRKLNKSFLSLLSKYNIKTYDDIFRLVKAYERGYYIEAELEEYLKEALEIAIEDKLVWVKRDPALHRDSWQVMKPVLVDGYAIHFPPQSASPLNLDYDGDSVSGDSIVQLFDENDNLIFNDKIEELTK